MTFNTSPLRPVIDEDSANYARDGVVCLRDEFDLIAAGRALLADPEWGTKVLEGRLDERRAYRVEMRARLE